MYAMWVATIAGAVSFRMRARWAPLRMMPVTSSTSRQTGNDTGIVDRIPQRLEPGSSGTGTNNGRRPLSSVRMLGPPSWRTTLTTLHAMKRCPMSGPRLTRSLSSWSRNKFVSSSMWLLSILVHLFNSECLPRPAQCTMSALISYPRR